MVKIPAVVGFQVVSILFASFKLRAIERLKVLNHTEQIYSRGLDYFYLTPCIPLSFKGEGEECLVKGLCPFKLPSNASIF